MVGYTSDGELLLIYSCIYMSISMAIWPILFATFLTSLNM